MAFCSCLKKKDDFKQSFSSLEPPTFYLTSDTSYNEQMIIEYVESLSLEADKKQRYLKQLLPYASISQRPKSNSLRTNDDEWNC